MFSKLHGTDTIPIIAECYGGLFRVYENKEFPGLLPSTELTKVRLSPFSFFLTCLFYLQFIFNYAESPRKQELFRSGVRVHVRETQRKFEKNSGSDNHSPSSTK